MDLFSGIEKLINEHGSSTILRERITLVKEVLSKTEKECSNLKDKVRQLETDKMQLSKELARISTSKEFQEYRGVLFKKEPFGGYCEDIYCPNCKIPMTSMELFFPFICSGCNKQSGFKGHDLTSVTDNLLKRYPC